MDVVMHKQNTSITRVWSPKKGKWVETTPAVARLFRTLRAWYTMTAVRRRCTWRGGTRCCSLRQRRYGPWNARSGRVAGAGSHGRTREGAGVRLSDLNHDGRWR